MVTGTSAHLREGDHLTLWDLIHGMMLPSGNDAGFLIADFLGRLLKLNKSEDCRLDIKTLPKSDSEISCGDYNTEDTDTVKSKDSPDNNDIMAIDETEKSNYVKYFLMEMNYIAREEFNLVCTFFDSPHGLSNRFNTSSAADIGKISSIALSNSVFAKIVKTKRYKCYTHKPSNYDEEKTLTEFKPRLYSWENTNKLLWKNGYTGLKTGITQTAGPCLAASFRCEITQEFYIIVILNSRSMEHRWSEISKLKAWASARMNKIKKSSLFTDNPDLEKKILTKIKHL